MILLIQFSKYLLKYIEVVGRFSTLNANNVVELYYLNNNMRGFFVIHAGYKGGDIAEETYKPRVI